MSALPRTGASSPTARQTPRQKTRQTPPEARSASQASECSAQSDATLAGSPDALQTPDATPAPVAAQLAPLAALAQLTDTLPVELLEAPRWIVFHLAWVEVKGKRKLQKTPYNARTGKLARSNDARTWSTYGRACQALAAYEYAVLGFATGDGFACVDLDKCRDAANGELKPEARAIVDELASYSEVSPSGTGVHIWVRGVLPTGGRKKPDIEMYAGSQFITITGEALEGAPPALNERTDALATLHARAFTPTRKPAPATPDAPDAPPDAASSGADRGASSPTGSPDDMGDAAVLARAFRDKEGAKFARLWSGDSSDYGDDASAADMWLVGKLRFYARGDASQIERLFRQSGRMRDKWDTRHYADGATYGAETIRKALEAPYEVWTPRGARGSSRSAASGGADRGPHSPTGGASSPTGSPSGGPTGGAESGEGIGEETAQGREAQATVLIHLAETAHLFKTPEGVAHARVKVGEHFETWQLGERGGAFKRWLVHQYYTLYGRAPSANAVSQALEVVIARALFEGEEHPVYIRLASHEGKVYHDLGDARWRCVEIDADGWRVLDTPPVYFRRPRSLAALPEPAHGGTLEELRPLIDPETEDDWTLICAWLVGALHPEGPYTHLSVNGHAGAGKSTKTRLLRTVIDPSSAPTRGEPKDEHDLAVAAYNNRVLALDNLSFMPQWLSDFICQLSTGSGSAYRTLYSDDEETIFNMRRPVILNGIEEVATRGDLLDRIISVTLTRISDEKRKTEGELDSAFAAAHGRILGALYDAVACALKRWPTTRVAKLPRMADFAKWIVAASPALGWSGERFLAVYRANREKGIATEIDASPVAAALLRFMQERSEWTGTASDLYELLTPLAGDAVQHTRAWPASPRALSGALKRLAPSLKSGEHIGVIHGQDDTRTPDGKHRGRFITLALLADTEDASDATPAYNPDTVTYDADAEDGRELAGWGDGGADAAPFAPYAPDGPDSEDGDGGALVGVGAHFEPFEPFETREGDAPPAGVYVIGGDGEARPVATVERRKGGAQ